LTIGNAKIGFSMWAIGIIRQLSHGVTKHTFIQFRDRALIVRRWNTWGDVEWL